MVVHQGFKFLLEVLIKFLFIGAQVFFILHSEVQFFLSYLLRWCYAIHDNLGSCFMIQQLSRMRYLNPPISSLELFWVIFHLKLSLRIVTIMVLIYDPISASHLDERVFISWLIPI